MSDTTDKPMGRKARAQHLRIATDSDRTTREALLTVAAGGARTSVQKAEGGAAESRALPNPWEQVRTTSFNFEMVVEPPFEPLGLAMLGEQSSELGQVIEAMETNIVGYGWRLKSEIDLATLEEEDDELKALIEEENERFDEFLRYVDYDEKSFVNLRKRTRRDLEQVGNAYWEIIRDDGGGISAFNHIPAYMMRLRLLETTTVLVDQVRVVGKKRKRRRKKVKIRKRFRSFVQARYTGIGNDEPQVVHFKQYGDPRRRSWRNGKVEQPGDEQKVKDADLATEIIHFKIYNPRSPYGVPRYIGNLLSIFGSRAAEEINYTTFKNNNIPSMAILVSNGFLTDGTAKRITQFVESAIQGSDNYSKFLVIEAEGLMEGTDPTNVKVEIEKLADTQTQDELFQKYDANNQDKVRRAFRLPPIFVGRSDDYTRSTAETSRRIADEQVFDPERKEDDHTINRVLADMGMLYHQFETNTPNVTNDQDLIAVLTGAEKAGGTTPRIARMILEDILGRDLGGFSDELDPDTPFTLQMAEAVKNAANPAEPGQQLTAMKMLTEELGLDNDTVGMTFGLDYLLKASKHVKKDVVLNAGSQAHSILLGKTSGLLHPIAFALAGREMILGDGFETLGLVEFGTTEKMSLEAAAKSVGLEADDVRKMFPGRAEIWVSSVETMKKIDPVPYTQTADSYFAHVDE